MEGEQQHICFISIVSTHVSCVLSLHMYLVYCLYICILCIVSTHVSCTLSLQMYLVYCLNTCIIHLFGSVKGLMTFLLLCHYAGSSKGPLFHLPLSDVQRLQRTINKTRKWSQTTQYRVECGNFFLSDRTGQLTKGQA